MRLGGGSMYRNYSNISAAPKLSIVSYSYRYFYLAMLRRAHDIAMASRLSVHLCLLWHRGIVHGHSLEYFENNFTSDQLIFQTAYNAKHFVDYRIRNLQGHRAVFPCDSTAFLYILYCSSNAIVNVNGIALANLFMHHVSKNCASVIFSITLWKIGRY